MPVTEFLSGVFQGLISHWLIWLCTGGAAVIFATLRKYKPAWAPVAGYGFGAAVAVAVLFMMLASQTALVNLQQELSTISAKIPDPSPSVTQENIAALVKQWIEDFGYSLRIVKDDDKALFHYAVTFQSGQVPSTVIVGQEKQEPDYLKLVSIYVLSDESKARFKGLSAAQQNHLLSELRINLIRANVEWGSIQSPLDMVVVQRSLFITSDLSRENVTRAVFEVNSALLLARELIIDRLQARQTYQ